MSQLLIKIVAIGTKNFVLESILYGGNHSPNSLNIMYSTHLKSNMAQRLVVFPNNKHKMCEMQKHNIMIILVLNAGIVTRPQNPNW
jgi:hypothetical protein